MKKVSYKTAKFFSLGQVAYIPYHCHTDKLSLNNFQTAILTYLSQLLIIKCRIKQVYVCWVNIIDVLTLKYQNCWNHVLSTSMRAHLSKSLNC